MKKKIIAELNILAGDELETKIIEYLTEGEFTVDQLIEACKGNKIEVSPSILNSIGFWCGKPGNKLFRTYNEAIALYEYAAELGNSAAMGNLAFYHFKEKFKGERDLGLALHWCQRSIDSGSIDRNVLKATILREQGEYSDAMVCLGKITDDTCSDEDVVKKARELEKKIKGKMSKKIEKKSSKISDSDNDSDDSDDKSKGKKSSKDAIDVSDDVDEELAKELAAADIEDLTYKDKVVKHTVTGQDKRSVSVYGFPDKAVGKEREIIWEQEATAKFFRFGKDLREGKQSHQIYLRVVQQVDGTNKSPINLQGCCRRSFIIALAKILTKYDGMPNLIFRLGGTTIRFEETDDSVKVRQHGNFKMVIPSLGDFQIAYGDGLITRLSNILAANWDDSVNKKERKKNLLNFMTKGFPTFTSFTSQNLNKYGKINIFSEEFGYGTDIQKNADFLNGLFFLFSIVEVLERAYRTIDGNLFHYPVQYRSGEESDLFPIGMAQARSLVLLVTGTITFTDFFGQSKPDADYGADYGATTGTGTTYGQGLEYLSEKLNRINEAYDQFYLNQNNSPWTELRTEYIQDNAEGFLISGKSRMRHELKIVYGSGGESDSETSDYSDDDSKVVVFKPKSNK